MTPTTTTHRAFHLAIEALHDARRPLAFDANRSARGIVVSDRTRRAHQQYAEYTAAIAVLKGEIQVEMRIA